MGMYRPANPDQPSILRVWTSMASVSHGRIMPRRSSASTTMSCSRATNFPEYRAVFLSYARTQSSEFGLELYEAYRGSSQNAAAAR